MKYYEQSHKELKGEKRKTNMETVDEILTYPIREIEDRGISQDVAELFGVRCLFNGMTGKPEAYYFPYYKKDKIVGFKKRDLRYPKKSELHFSTIGNVDIDCELFGQHLCSTGKSVYITEGEWDAMFAYQVLMDLQQIPGKYIPNIVSIGFGTKNAAEHVGNNLQFLQQYKEVRVVFDNDEADEKELKKGIMRGKEATSEVCLLLGDLSRVIELHFKDCCEYLDDQKELYRRLAFTAKPYEPDVLVKGGVGVDVLMEPIKPGVMIGALPGTSHVLHGLREGEVTVVIAPTNVGKSTICREIGYSLTKAAEPTAFYFIEEDMKKTQQALIALDNNVLLPRFRENPSILSRDKVEKSNKELIDSGKTMWVDTKKTFGKLTPKEFIKSLRWADAMGMKFAILDHISMIFSASENDNERKEIDNLMTEIAAFATTSRMHIIVVAHIKRVPNIAPKDREGNIQYPYWQNVDKDAARGSGAFEQLSDNLVVIEPEFLEGGARGRIRTRVVKNREWGTLGIGDILTMHPTTGRLIGAARDEDELELGG